MRTCRPILSLVIVLSLFPAVSQARDKQASTAPGKYKEWGPDIDEIEIVKTFKTADYNRVIVQPFDTSKVPLPDKNAKWYGTMKIVLAGYTEAFVEALGPELKAKVEVSQAAEPPKTAKTLILRGSVEDLDPGSRGGRYFGGFGAGSASTKLSYEIVDAASGQVLARVTQSRRSGGSFKIGGGSDQEVMRDSIHAEGKDAAHILDAF